MAKSIPVETEIQILQSLSLKQVQVAAEWLFHHPDPNPDLEVALNLVLTERIIPENTGELLAIAHTVSRPEALTPEHICGVVMASPGNRNVLIVGGNCAAAEVLLALVQTRGGPYKMAASRPTRD